MSRHRGLRRRVILLGDRFQLGSAHVVVAGGGICYCRVPAGKCPDRRRLVVSPAKQPTCWALVPAAGAGTRFGGPEPKQFQAAGGVPLLHRTLRALLACPRVAGLAVAVPADRLDRQRVLPPELRADPRVRLCAGGASRTASVRAALELLPDDCGLVLVHDGARPRVASGLVERVAAAAERTGACAPGLAPADTVKRVGADGRVAATLEREALRLIQTPQGFRREVLERAYAWLDAQPAPPRLTDDAGLVEASGQPVALVAGEPDNLKITRPRDLAAAGLALPRVGHGYDVHRLVAGRPLRLGGVEVPAAVGLLGHSDGDVALHALADALLGAAALGDIGRMFPDDDPAWAGADSRALLARVVERLAASGLAPASADVTIVAQRPRLAAHLPAMAAAVARVLGLDAGEVNVKATTEEGLGLTGDGQAMAAYAVCVVAPAGPAAGGAGRSAG